MSEKFNPVIEVEDDGLFIPEVREWSLEKYKLQGTYCDIFTNGMKNRWDRLVYIDLFAGAGYSKIHETGRIYKSSALIALSIPNLFSKYIFSEQSDDRFNALKQRIERDYSHLDITLIHGDSNENIKEVYEAIPKYSRNNTVLPFCFVDPFSLNLKFATIETLGKNNLMDFLILQALHMDANRNFAIYYEEENTKIADYLGVPNWRNQFNERNEFVRFLADTYRAQMTRIGYKDEQLTHQIRSNEKNLPLYYLSFFTKHDRGLDFFKKVQKRVTHQGSLF